MWSLYEIVDPFVFPSFFFSLIRKPYLCTVTLIVKRIPRCLFRLKQLFKNLDHKWISIATVPPFAQLVKFLLIPFNRSIHSWKRERERERNFLISYFPRSRRKSETLVVQENWKPIRPPVYWFCKSSRNSESSGGGEGGVWRWKAINKNTGSVCTTPFVFVPRSG